MKKGPLPLGMAPCYGLTVRKLLRWPWLAVWIVPAFFWAEWWVCYFYLFIFGS